MSRSIGKPRLGCSTLGAFALLGGVIVLGLGGNGLSPLQSLAALGSGAGVLLWAWIWERTIRCSATTGPVSRGQQVWNAAVFAAWLAAMAALTWWYLQGDE